MKCNVADWSINWVSMVIFFDFAEFIRHFITHLVLLEGNVVILIALQNCNKKSLWMLYNIYAVKVLMDLLEYYTWGRTIIYDWSSLQMSKFMFRLQGLGICKTLKTFRHEKKVKMSKEWMCSINQFFWSVYPRSISPVLYFLILNIILKFLPVYVYVL